LSFEDLSRVVDECSSNLEGLLLRHLGSQLKWAEAKFEANKLRKVISAVNRNLSQKARHDKMAKLKAMVELGSGQKKCKKTGHDEDTDLMYGVADSDCGDPPDCEIVMANKKCVEPRKMLLQKHRPNKVKVMIKQLRKTTLELAKCVALAECLDEGARDHVGRGTEGEGEDPAGCLAGGSQGEGSPQDQGSCER
jgi:hypothetical protein